MTKIGRYSEVHPSVLMGDHSVIGNYCVIGKNVTLGKNVVIGNYCQVEEGTTIDDGTVLQGSVKTGKHCEIGKKVTLKWGVILTTDVRVEENVFMGARAVTLGSTAERKTEYGTLIQENAYIGGGAIIAPNLRIYRDVIVGAMAYVNMNLCASGTFVGVPAKQIK